MYKYKLKQFIESRKEIVGMLTHHSDKEYALKEFMSNGVLITPDSHNLCPALIANHIFAMKDGMYSFYEIYDFIVNERDVLDELIEDNNLHHLTPAQVRNKILSEILTFINDTHLYGILIKE